MDDLTTQQVDRLIELVFQVKPYLRILENQFTTVPYGEVTATFKMHNAQVENMTIIAQETIWKRQNPKKEIEIPTAVHVDLKSDVV